MNNTYTNLLLIVCSALTLGTGCDPGVNLIEVPADQSTDIDADQAPDMDQPDGVEDMIAADIAADIKQDEDMDMSARDMATDLQDMTQDMVPDMPAQNAAPTRYSGDQLISPMTTSVAQSLLAIKQKSTKQDNVFMKVGASGTVSTRLLNCFAPASSFRRDLHTYTALQPTLDYFNGGNAMGESPFIRKTLAAKSGRTASWVQSGSPSPLAQEISAISPRYAFVNYGTNDMQMGATYRSAMFPFYQNMSSLLDDLIAQGIIPIISGLNPRTDNASASQWVPTYNTLTRAMAEARQIPYIDLYLASKNLPKQGLLNDGIHGNVFSDGGSQPCIFTDEALAYNYNIRNLLSAQTLHRTKALVVDNAAAPDTPTPWQGTGKQSDPFVTDTLPFTHASNTQTKGQSLIDAYPSCDSGQNESGPEVYYRFTLNEETPVRVMVFDLAGVDVDIHLLGANGDPMNCLDRNDKTIERTLPAGDYTIVVDTFVSRNNTVNHGAYTLIVQPCDPGDASCK